MGSDRRARSAVRWMLALLAVGWIVLILPALPLPYCRQIPRLLGHLPDWRDQALTAGARVGTVIGLIAWGLWAAASGTLEHVHLDPTFVPLTARAWFADAIRWGGLLGMLGAAALVPWVLWMAGRLGCRRRGERSSADLRVRRLLGTAIRTAWANPGRFVVLLLLGVLPGWMQASADRLMGHPGSIPSAAAVALTMPLATLVLMLAYGFGLSLLDGKERSATDILGGPARVARFAAASVLICVGSALGTILFVVPGITGAPLRRP